MFPALVQQVNVGRIFDVSRSYGSVQNQLSAILLSPLLLLFRGVAVALALALLFCRLFSDIFFRRSRCSFVIIMSILLIRFLDPISIHFSHVLRTLASAEILVDLCCFLHRETLAEMNHHGRVKQWLILKCVQAEEVLHIGVFLDFCYGAFIRQVAVFFDEKGAECNPGGDGRTSRLTAHVPGIDLINVRPRHHCRHLHPAVVFAQFSAEGKEEVIDVDLIGIAFVIHSKHPIIAGFSRKLSFLGLPYYTAILNVFLQYIQFFFRNYRIL